MRAADLIAEKIVENLTTFELQNIDIKYLLENSLLPEKMKKYTKHIVYENIPILLLRKGKCDPSKYEIEICYSDNRQNIEKKSPTKIASTVLFPTGKKASFDAHKNFVFKTARPTSCPKKSSEKFDVVVDKETVISCVANIFCCFPTCIILAYSENDAKNVEFRYDDLYFRTI